MNWKEAADDTMVCYCKKITKDTIVRAIKAGNSSLKEIQQATTACTGGNCKEMNPSGKCCSGDILEILRIYSDGTDGEGSGCCSCCS